MNKHNFIPRLIIPLTSGYVIRVLNNRGLAFIWQSLHFTRKYGGEQMLWSCTHLESFCLNRKLSQTVTALVTTCAYPILYFFQTFDDGATVLTKCSVERLQSILSPDEAKNNRLIVSSYKNAVQQFCNEGKSDDKIMIVAFEKESSDPSGLILLKKRSYEASKLTSISGHAVASDMRATTRKLMWEVSYCVRRADKRSLCLGDILLSCAIEEVRNRAKNDPHGASTYIWLVLAGGFSNVPALRLYLAHGFEIIGVYEVESEVLMAVRNVGDESTRRVLKQVKGKLESTFLLPVLKNAAAVQPAITWMAPNDIFATSSTGESQESQSTEVSGVKLFSQQSSVATGKATAESELQATSSSSKLETQIACPHETQEDQFSDEEVICEQSLEIHMASPQETQEDEIQMATPQETQEDQFPHSGVSDEEVISEQSPAATKVGDNPVEQEDEEDEVSK